MDDEGVLEAARLLRPYLPQLMTPTAAEKLDRQVASLLDDAAGGQNVTARLWELLGENRFTRTFLRKVLADAPAYRPPDVKRRDRRRGPGELPGERTPVQADKFVCPNGHYTWYRQAVEEAMPRCPSDGLELVRG